MKVGLCLLLLCLMSSAAQAADLPQWQQPPLYGVLSEGVLALEAGGDFSGSAISNECHGSINPLQPDVNVVLKTAEAVRLSAQSDRDISLIIYTPSREWLCTDDTSESDLNPSLTIIPAEVGVYNIWIGSIEPSKAPKAELRLEKLVLPNGFAADE